MAHPCPTQFNTASNTQTADLAYISRIRHDQLILNVIIGSFSPSLIPFIATARTSADTWNTLALTYGKPSCGRITQLKTQLRNPVKGFQSITEFMQFIKSKADELALMNAAMDGEDLTIKVLQGLDDDYKELAHAI